MTYTVATANGWKVVLGNVNYPIRYWNGTNTNFSLSDDGDVVARSVTVSQKDDDSAMLTLLSTPVSVTNAYAMEVFNSGPARKWALDEEGNVSTAGFVDVYAEAQVPAFGAIPWPSIELDGASHAILFGPGGAATPDWSLGWKATDELLFSGNASVYWGTSISSRLEAGNGIILRERAIPGSPGANTVHLYAKDSAGTSRLFYKDDANVEHGPL